MVIIHGHTWPALLLLSLLLLTSAKTPVFSYSMLFTLTGTPSRPPYGIPAPAFAKAISSANNNPISSASFPLPGYNTSIPAGPDDGTGNVISSWRLAIDVAANVPLIGAADHLAATISQNKNDNVTEVAILSLSSPSVVSLDADSWRICAVVFSRGLSDDVVNKAEGSGGKLDGTCNRYLSSECIQALQVNSIANNTIGRGKANGCQGLEVPAACGKKFIATVGDGYEINSTYVKQIDGNNRYPFAMEASSPTSRDDATVVMAMERMIRPVVITWTHFSASGEVHDSAGWLSCVTAPKITNPEWKDSETNGGALGREKSMWALIVALVLTAVMTTF